LALFVGRLSRAEKVCAPFGWTKVGHVVMVAAPMAHIPVTKL
jgi:hypothetical protein